MCGLVGFISSSNTLDSQQTIKTMMDQLIHRGPNDQGNWFDQKTGIGLGHRRLSVIDLSPQGAQPMLSHCGRYVLVYNGEIYNYKNLRKDLDSDYRIQWRGHSDTEVLITAISNWGLEKTLPRLNGMFAFALWDKHELVLHLARDPFGEKPLYYGWSKNTFLFASELKALRVFPQFSNAINMDALADFLRYGYVPSPKSIYQNIHKLLPGTYISLATDTSQDELPEQIHYWSAEVAISTAKDSAFTGNEADAIDLLEQMLTDAVGQRMEADVPLGAMLSGGIDSSTIVALMQLQSSKPIQTFSIGSKEPGYDETKFSRAVAKHIGTDHTALYVEPADILAVIPKLPTLYDEPFADSSQIPTYIVSNLAHQHVTVALSGDGGDELFGGYNRYIYGAGLWSKLAYMPLPLRKVVSSVLKTISPAAWNRVLTACTSFIPIELRTGQGGEKLHKLAGVLNVRTEADLIQLLLENGNLPEKLLLDNWHRHDHKMSNTIPDILVTFAERAMFNDILQYLPDDILTKVDRASMGVSLEVRAPFLDKRIFNFAWSLPLQMKLCNGKGKYLLRQVLNRYIPLEIIERPKQGFAVPVGRWLRNELKEWGDSLLDRDRLKDQGYLNPDVVKNIWNAHLSGRVNYDTRLWSILMFQAWLDKTG